MSNVRICPAGQVTAEDFVKKLLGNAKSNAKKGKAEFALDGNGLRSIGTKSGDAAKSAVWPSLTSSFRTPW
jgi:hypothetical protein